MATSSQLLRSETLETFQIRIVGIGQLYLLSRISPLFTITTVIILVQATIICHLDYCISLLSGLCFLLLSPTTVCSVHDNENNLFKMKDHVTLLFKICN